MNTGKRFENDFKKSTPSYALLYRIPDPPQSFKKASNLRFSSKPPFDYILWDSSRHKLFALELKTKNGKSISFERSKEDNGDIHYHQIEQLNLWSSYDGIIAGLIIEFRSICMTIFIEIEEFNKLIKAISKKSFNLQDLIDHNIKYKSIEQKIKKTHFSYDVEGFLKSF